MEFLKKITLVLGIGIPLIGISVVLAVIRPEYPVEYVGNTGIDDYINGNAIDSPSPDGMRLLQSSLFGWKDWTKEGMYPLITEDDWIIVTIDSGKQKQAWGTEYSKQDLLMVAQRELEWIEKDNKNGSRDKQIARIQSFIDILSKR